MQLSSLFFNMKSKETLYLFPTLLHSPWRQHAATRLLCMHATTYQLLPFWRYLDAADGAAAVKLDEKSWGNQAAVNTSSPPSEPITDKYDFLFLACSC